MHETDRRSAERKQAEKMYVASDGNIVLAQIAKNLGVSASKVRKWKSLDHWESLLNGAKQDGAKKKVERSTSKSKKNKVVRSTSKGRNKGGQPGNKNAAKADDSFSRIYGSCFSEEEMALVKEMPDTEELILKDQIKVLVVREHRIIKRLNEYYKSQNEKTLDTESTQETVRVFEDGTPEENEMDKAEYHREVLDEQAEGKRKPGRSRLLTRNLTNKDNYIARLEHELTTVQLAKERCIQDLMKYSLEKQKLDGNGKSDATKAWLEALMETDGETDE